MKDVCKGLTLISVGLGALYVMMNSVGNLTGFGAVVIVIITAIAVSYWA